MPVAKLKQYLDSNSIKYVSIQHSPAYTAQEAAASAHIPGKELAKTVVMKLDGELVMVVLPASYKVDFERLSEATGASAVALAGETDFKDRFPDCEVGAMPPFGNLYQIKVYVAQSLADDDEIAFNACSHTELIRLRYADFQRLVQPVVMKLSVAG